MQIKITLAAVSTADIYFVQVTSFACSPSQGAQTAEARDVLPHGVVMPLDSMVACCLSRGSPNAAQAHGDHIICIHVAVSTACNQVLAAMCMRSLSYAGLSQTHKASTRVLRRHCFLSLPRED